MGNELKLRHSSLQYNSGEMCTDQILKEMSMNTFEEMLSPVKTAIFLTPQKQLFHPIRRKTKRKNKEGKNDVEIRKIKEKLWKEEDLSSSIFGDFIRTSGGSSLRTSYTSDSITTANMSDIDLDTFRMEAEPDQPEFSINTSCDTHEDHNRTNDDIAEIKKIWQFNHNHFENKENPRKEELKNVIMKDSKHTHSEGEKLTFQKKKGMFLERIRKFLGCILTKRKEIKRDVRIKKVFYSPQH